MIEYLLSLNEEVKKVDEGINSNLLRFRIQQPQSSYDLD